MNTEILKKKLAETKSALKAISNDAHYAEKLIADLLSIKGQMDVEPTLSHIPMADIVETLEGNNFVIYKTKGGIMFHQRNSFDLFIPSNGFTKGLYEIMDYLVENKDKIADAPQDEKDMYEAFMYDLGETMSLPFSLWVPDAEIYRFRGETIDNLFALLNRILEGSSENIPEDDHEANAAFEKATMALHEISNDENE